MTSKNVITKQILFVFSPCPFINRIPETVDNNPERLVDNSDLHLLDYQPSLKTLSILVVLENNIDTSILPRDIM